MLLDQPVRAYVSLDVKNTFPGSVGHREPSVVTFPPDFRTRVTN